MTSIRATRRVVGTAIVLWLAVALFAPLYSAMTACAMPCCHHSSPAPIAKAPTPCDNCQIAASHDDELANVAIPATTHASVAAPTAVVIADVVVPAAPHRVAPADDHHRSVDRPLHLVNSVFLI